VRRQERYLREANSHRLRHTRTREFALVPALGPSAFHVFLSHAWGGGTQEKVRLMKEHLGALVPGVKAFLESVAPSSATR
jgi:hypothetical protein